MIFEQNQNKISGTEFWEKQNFGKKFLKKIFDFFWKIKIWKKILEKKFSIFFFNFKYFN